MARPGRRTGGSSSSRKRATWGSRSSPRTEAAAHSLPVVRACAAARLAKEKRRRAARRIHAGSRHASVVALGALPPASAKADALWPIPGVSLTKRAKTSPLFTQRKIPDGPTPSTLPRARAMGPPSTEQAPTEGSTRQIVQHACGTCKGVAPFFLRPQTGDVVHHPHCGEFFNACAPRTVSTSACSNHSRTFSRITSCAPWTLAYRDSQRSIMSVNRGQPGHQAKPLIHGKARSGGPSSFGTPSPGGVPRLTSQLRRFWVHR